MLRCCMFYFRKQLFHKAFSATLHGMLFELGNVIVRALGKVFQMSEAE